MVTGSHTNWMSSFLLRCIGQAVILGGFGCSSRLMLFLNVHGKEQDTLDAVCSEDLFSTRNSFFCCLTISLTVNIRLLDII